MRQDIIDFIGTLNLGSFVLSSELPWSESNTPLYFKNLKRIYVDVDQFTNQPVITALNGFTINNEVTLVRLYFATDAKQLPPNYDEVVDQLRSAKDVASTEGFNQR